MRSRAGRHSSNRVLPPLPGPETAQNEGMESEFTVICPYCGEAVEIYVEPDVRGTLVQDCEVCCNPWTVRVRGRGEDRTVEVLRSDE